MCGAAGPAAGRSRAGFRPLSARASAERMDWAPPPAAASAGGRRE